MCRLFGFRSVLQSRVHTSLLEADNALAAQSEFHPDGWGVAYYIAQAPHLIKSVESAVTDQLFKRVSGVVTSQTVIAHLRKATVGQLNIVNTHPFQYGRWVFAHNGNLKSYEQHRPKLLQMVADHLRPYILGGTDSELIFYLLLTELEKTGPLHAAEPDPTQTAAAVRSCVQLITDTVGPIHSADDGPPTETYLSFLLTNGDFMLAHQGGKRLLFSTYKQRCPERDDCPFFGPSCEAPPATGQVNHLVVTSEALHGENVWQELGNGNIIGVDAHMRLFNFPEK